MTIGCQLHWRHILFLSVALLPLLTKAEHWRKYCRSTRFQTFAGLSETQQKQSIEARTADGQTLRLSRLSDRQNKHIIDTSIAARSALRLSRLSGGQYKQSIDTSCRGAERLQTLWTGMTEVGAVGRQWGGSGMQFLDAFSQAPAAPRWMHFLRYSQHCIGCIFSGTRSTALDAFSQAHCFGFSDPLSPAHGLRSCMIFGEAVGRRREVHWIHNLWGGSGMHFLDAFSQAPAAPRWMHFLRHSQHCFGFSDPLSPAHGLRSGFILQHCIGFSESLSPTHGSHSGFI